jgi:hypothetical protein
MRERTLSAVATDGRWEWYASGTPFPFEDLNRYTARRIRDRLDRELLVHYLQELGIDADQDTAYGLGIIVQQDVAWSRRTVSLEAARAELDRSWPGASMPADALFCRRAEVRGEGRARSAGGRGPARAE